MRPTQPILIIGAGLAGLSTALRLADAGKSVLLVTKGKLLDSNSRYAQGGIAAVMSPTDSFASHISDTLAAGEHYNVKAAVNVLVKQAPKQIAYLESLGVHFDETLGLEGGHSHRRIVHVADHTGLTIVETLIAQVQQRPRIIVWEQAQATRLLQATDHAIVGAEILRNGGTSKAKVEIVRASHTVLATGGVSALYSHTTNPAGAIGNGLSMAIEAGAATKDLEFIQFHPTALNIANKPHFLLSEALRGEGAHIVNEHGTGFMKQYSKQGDLAPRDVVSRATYLEMQITGLPVYLDARHFTTAFVKEHFPMISAELKQYGLNLTKHRIPITPAAHYHCGGVVTNLRGETSLPGLYAVGEVARTGVQGANRLASNSLLECLVFSEQVADAIVADTKLTMHITKIEPSHITYGKVSIKLQKQVKAIMWDHIGIVRTVAGMAEGVKTLELLHTNTAVPAELAYIGSALAIARAAAKRTTSLGAHYIHEPTFTERVLDAVKAIPRGETRSYAEVAEMAGAPGASRAVGTIMKHNFNPDVPCHRVIQSNGALGDYNRGGSAAKRRLLLAEGVKL